MRKTFSNKFLKLTLLFSALSSFAFQTKVQTQAPGNESQTVLLQVTVTDSAGRPVYDLKREDFRLSENNVPQDITFFSKEEIPLTYGLVIDNSGSFAKSIEQIADAAKVMVNNNKPHDETLIIRFVDLEKINLVQDFTSDKAALVAGLDTLYIEYGPTDIIDAVYLSAQKIKTHRQGEGKITRRAVILMTDGENRESHYSFNDLVKVLQVEHVQVFAIGLTKHLSKDVKLIYGKSQREQAVKFLTELTKRTGGMVFFPESAADLQSVINEIFRNLRTQYMIGYKKSPNDKGSASGALTVNLSPDIAGKARAATVRGIYIINNK